MRETENYGGAARVILALLVLGFGISLAGLAFLRLVQGSFPYPVGRILKLVLGIVLVFGGWITLKPIRWRSVPQFLDCLKRLLQKFASGMRWVVAPVAGGDSHSLVTRLALTAVMFGGLGMIALSFIKHLPDPELESWYRPDVLRPGGLAIAVISGVLRSGRRAKQRNYDWLTSGEMLLLIGVAALVTATDIYCSRIVGMLASPPYYDGVGYMLDAKRALLQLGTWKLHPIHFANAMLANRYPVWQALMVLNFRLFGVGEWQAYATRFWPTLVVLAAAFWVVRRHAGPHVGWAVALFTALLPTLSLNVRSAAAGHPLYPAGYLTDLRPDLLFAAFLMLFVVLIVEHGQTLDERTAILAGIAAALAALTKTSAMAAVFLAGGLAAGYALFINSQNVRKNLPAFLWAVLTFVVLLTPWMLAGGLVMTIDYLRTILTVELPLYSNVNPTIHSEITYYYPFLIAHMGWPTVVMALASPLLLYRTFRKGGSAWPLILQAMVYFLIAVSLYALVSVSLAKNYFLGLPCYLVLWVFCWLTIALFLTLWPSWIGRIGWSLLSVAIIMVGVAGFLVARNLPSWQGHEFEEGRQDREAMQQMAVDLREVLSGDETFVAMTAYGNPATILFYMPDQQGRLPYAPILDGSFTGPIQDFIQQNVEHAKAVLVYANGNQAASFKGYAPVVTYPYYSAIAAWVQRPGSAHHLRKIYHLYRTPGSDQAGVELYVRDDPR